MPYQPFTNESDTHQNFKIVKTEAATRRLILTHFSYWQALKNMAILARHGRSSHWRYSVEISKNAFFTEHLRTTDSDMG